MEVDVLLDLVGLGVVVFVFEDHLLFGEVFLEELLAAGGVADGGLDYFLVFDGLVLAGEAPNWSVTLPEARLVEVEELADGGLVVLHDHFFDAEVSIIVPDFVVLVALAALVGDVGLYGGAFERDGSLAVEHLGLF